MKTGSERVADPIPNFGYKVSFTIRPLYPMGESHRYTFWTPKRNENSLNLSNFVFKISFRSRPFASHCGCTPTYMHGTHTNACYCMGLREAVSTSHQYAVPNVSNIQTTNTCD